MNTGKQSVRQYKYFEAIARALMKTDGLFRMRQADKRELGLLRECCTAGNMGWRSADDEDEGYARRCEEYVSVTHLRKVGYEGKITRHCLAPSNTSYWVDTEWFLNQLVELPLVVDEETMKRKRIILSCPK
jgi:hypothetical protein